MNFSTGLAGISLLFLACASNQGTRPHDMSTAGHDAAAEQEAQAAEYHQAQSTAATAASASPDCGTGRGGCWSSLTNPTTEHAAEAQRHRELAEKHRAASAALGEAEAQSCSGISEGDRDISPFAHREDISSVSPLEESERAGKGTVTRRVGARVVFRAVPGMTAEWLQRVVNCHLARAAAAGYEMPGMAYCPLMLKGVSARVSSVGDGFAVDIRSGDAATQDAILQRAMALASAPAKP